MKKVFVLALVLMFLVVFNIATLADEIYGGSVSFNVKWQVEPKIYFGIAYGDFSSFAAFENGNLFSGTPFLDYVFETRSPVNNFFTECFDPYAEEEVWGMPIFAGVASNDWWKLEFVKPQLVSDNDHYTTVPVYANRYLFDWNGSESSTGWFSGNDVFTKDMGVYGMVWDLKVIYKNWHTRYGNYENTFQFIVTQL